VEEVLNSTMGFEIISQGEKTCVVRSIAKAVESEFDNILRRVFLTLLSMAEESYDAISKSQFSRLGSIGASDSTINKLTNFCKRILNKKGYKDQKSNNYVYCIVWEIERIGDEYKDICHWLGTAKKSKISRNILQIYKETNEFLRNFYNLFYKFDSDNGVELTNKKKSLLKKCRELIPKISGADSVILHHLTNIITATYDIAGPYYAMVL
jgi:Na+/phosphate symporter